MRVVDNEESPKPGQYDPGSSLTGHAAGQSELDLLLDDLVSIHGVLSQGVMPRAARITGTGHQLAQTVARLEGAIRTTKELIVDSRRSLADSPSRRALGTAFQRSANP